MRKSLLVAVLVTALAATGGALARSGAPRGQTPDQVVAAAIAAVKTAKSVHVKGTGSLNVELWLDAAKGGRGTLEALGEPIEIVRIGPAAYFRASDGFWTKAAGPAAAKKVHGRWVQVSATSGQFASLAKITDLRLLLTTVLNGHGKQLTAAGTSTVDGVQAIGIRDGANGGTLYVAASGKPYPVALVKSGGGGGKIAFDQWDQPVSLAAPGGAVPASAIGR